MRPPRVKWSGIASEFMNSNLCERIKLDRWRLARRISEPTSLCLQNNFVSIGVRFINIKHVPPLSISYFRRVLGKQLEPAFVNYWKQLLIRSCRRRRSRRRLTRLTWARGLTSELYSLEVGVNQSMTIAPRRISDEIMNLFKYKVAMRMQVLCDDFRALRSLYQNKSFDTVQWKQ